jgi:hypothetical protein
MKKTLLLLALICLPLLASAQTEDKQQYIYNIVTFTGNLRNIGFAVHIDNGRTIERLKDRDGYKLTFHTPAAALMYLISEGWELYVSGGTTEGGSFNGTGGSETTSFWIIRKPCTQEEFDMAVEESIKDRVFR